MAYRTRPRDVQGAGPTTRWAIFKVRHREGLAFALGLAAIALIYLGLYGIGFALHLIGLQNCFGWGHVPSVCYPLLGAVGFICTGATLALLAGAAHAIGLEILGLTGDNR